MVPPESAPWLSTSLSMLDAMSLRAWSMGAVHSSEGPASLHELRRGAVLDILGVLKQT
jgi:hypothetical protein